MANSKAKRERNRKARRRQEHLIYSRLEKLRRGCEITGRRLPPEQLEWHHPDPSQKAAGVARLINQGVGSMTFLRELWKCMAVGKDVHTAIHKQKKR